MLYGFGEGSQQHKIKRKKGKTEKIMTGDGRKKVFSHKKQESYRTSFRFARIRILLLLKVLKRKFENEFPLGTLFYPFFAKFLPAICTSVLDNGVTAFVFVRSFFRSINTETDYKSKPGPAVSFIKSSGRKSVREHPPQSVIPENRNHQTRFP